MLFSKIRKGPIWKFKKIRKKIRSKNKIKENFDKIKKDFEKIKNKKNKKKLKIYHTRMDE